MKKLLSIFITASLALSFAVPVMADENKITPEEVEALIWSDPLSNHAECDTLMNMVFYQPEDVTAQESIKDKANPERSVKSYNLQDANLYVWMGSIREFIDTEFTDIENFQWIIESYEDPDRVFTLMYSKENNIYVGYSAPEHDKEGLYQLDYEHIADVINSNDIGTIKDIRLFFSPDSVYIETDKDEYFLVKYYNMTNEYSEYAGNGPVQAKVIEDELITCSELLGSEKQRRADQDAAYDKLYQQVHERMPDIVPFDYEPPEPRDTDSLAPYIDTPSRFSDVTDERLIPYVNIMADRGVVTGYEDGMFYPDKEVTRMEAAMMITRLMDFPLVSGSRTYFLDVNVDDERVVYVEKLAEYGIISGDGNGYFNPDDHIDFNQLFKICCNIIGYNEPYFLPTYLGVGYPIATNRIALDRGLDRNLNVGDLNNTVTRGDLAVVLGNMLDAHMQGGAYTITGGTMLFEDITLADYLAGEESIGYILFPSQWSDWDAGMGVILEYNCHDIIDEFRIKTSLTSIL